MRAAIYCRVSGDAQEREGTSLDSQREADLAKGKELGYDTPGTFVLSEVGSRLTLDRPKLNQLRQWVRDKQVDAVIVYVLDRLSGDPAHTIILEDEMERHGVQIISVTEDIDSSDLGKLVSYIRGYAAKLEVEKIRERTMRGRRARYEKGQWAAGSPMPGYRYVIETKYLEIREDEAIVVARIYNLYVYDRFGMEKIARLLNSEGIRTRRGNIFYLSVIRDILQHPGYKGEHPTGAKLPAIITPELWELAQKRRYDNPHIHRRRESPWLLQGLMHCGLCGHVLSCGYSNNKRQRVYSCPSRKLRTDPEDSHKCTLPILDATWLENEVFKTVTNILSKPEGMQKAISDTIQLLQARRDELEVTVQPIQDRLANIDKQLTKLAQNWVKGDIGDAGVSKMRGKLVAEKQRLSAIKAEIHPGQLDELAHVKERLKLYDNELELIEAGKLDRPFVVMDALPSIGEPGGALTDGDVTKAERAILDRFQAAVWVFPDRVEIKGSVLCPMIPIQDFASSCRGEALPVVPIQDFASTCRGEVLPVKLVLEIKK